jgi:hypothetical protein
VGQSDHVAAAPWRGDVRAGALHPRADDVAPIDRVAQGAVREGAEGAEIADGREAGPDRVAGVADADQDLVRGRGDGRRDAGRLDVADEVGVDVDQAGQDGQVAEIDDVGIVGCAVAEGPDGRDPTVAADVDDPVRVDGACLDVDQTAAAKCAGTSANVGDGSLRPKRSAIADAGEPGAAERRRSFRGVGSVGRSRA